MLSRPVQIENIGSLTRAVFRPDVNDMPEVVGSGFLLRKRRDVFLVTANHVLYEGSNAKSLFFDVGEGNRLRRIDGEAIQPLVPIGVESAPLDVCAIHLNNTVASQIPDEILIQHDHLSQQRGYEQQSRHVLIGSPVSMNARPARPEKHEAVISSYALDSRECPLSKYEELELDPSIYLAIDWDRKRLYSPQNARRQGPCLKGLSGAPIWLLDGSATTVAGIAIEQHAQARKAIVGVRWKIVADLLGL